MRDDYELDMGLADAIAAIPGLAEKLVAEHVADSHGRCPLCPVGAHAGHQRWPCRIHSYATAALEQATWAGPKRPGER